MDNRIKRETVNNNTAAEFLGCMMILSSILMLVTRFSTLEINGVQLSVDDGPLGIFSRFLLLVGGLIILKERGRGNYFAVGVYALTLGTSRLLRTLPNLVAESDFVFYTSIFIVLLSANLALKGYNHLTVRLKNPLSMRYTTILIVSFYAIVLLYCAYMRFNPSNIMEYLPDILWYIPLYFALLAVLFSKEVVDKSPMGRIVSFTDELTLKTSIGSTITVSEEDAEKIREGIRGPQGWKEKTVGGTTVYEENITFRTPKGDRDVVLEGCSEDRELRITVIDDRIDSFINGYRLRVSSYSESEGTIELRDDIGVCAVLQVGGMQ